MPNTTGFISAQNCLLWATLCLTVPQTINCIEESYSSKLDTVLIRCHTVIRRQRSPKSEIAFRLSCTVLLNSIEKPTPT